jgi:hypothetical protein
LLVVFLLVLVGRFLGGVCVASKQNGSLTFDFFPKMRKIFRNKNPRPMGYSAGAGGWSLRCTHRNVWFWRFSPLFSGALACCLGEEGFFFPKKKKSSGCHRIPRNQRITRQGESTMFLLIQVHFCFIKPPQQHRRFVAVAKNAIFRRQIACRGAPKHHTH